MPATATKKLTLEKLKKYGAKKAAKLGIKTEEQIVKLIHAWRKEQKTTESVK